MFKFIIDNFIQLSVTSSLVAVVIMLIRYLTKKRFPAAFSYALWVVLLIKLVIPIPITNPINALNLCPNDVKSSFIDLKVESGSSTQSKSSTVSGDIETIANYNQIIQQNSNINSGPINPTLTVKPFIYLSFENIMFLIWLCGVFGMFITSIVFYLKTINRFRYAVKYNSTEITKAYSYKLNIHREIPIFLSDRITSPVVCGFITPKIYLPYEFSKNNDDLETEYILSHELTHIKRWDFIFKPLAHILLCLYWFNPIIWLCYKLFLEDMERSCDEKVLHIWNDDIRKDYANSLLKISIKQNNLTGLLAFGENSLKTRIVSVLNYKKPQIWMAATAILLATLIAVTMLGNPLQSISKISGSTSSSSDIKGWILSNIPEPKAPILAADNIDRIPEKAEQYARQAMRQSDLSSINENGQIDSVFDSLNQYSYAKLSPDGKNLLMKLNDQGGGEGRMCNYAVYNLETKKTYNYSEMQGSFSNHKILTNNMIGFAFGSPSFNGDEKLEPILLYDMQYHPLDIKLQFDYGRILTNNNDKVYEKFILGIGYNKISKTFVLTYLIDQSTQSEQSNFFIKNNFGIALFDQDGKLIRDFLIQNQSIPNKNGFSFIPTDPVLTDDGYAIISIRDNKTICINLQSGAVNDMTFGKILSQKNNLYLTDNMDLVEINQGKIRKTTPLSINRNPYNDTNPFFIKEVILSDKGLYYLMDYGNTRHYCRLFYTDYKLGSPKLLSVYPSEGLNLAGMDENGKLLVLNGKFDSYTSEAYTKYFYDIENNVINKEKSIWYNRIRYFVNTNFPAFKTVDGITSKQLFDGVTKVYKYLFILNKQTAPKKYVISSEQMENKLFELFGKKGLVKKLETYRDKEHDCFSLDISNAGPILEFELAINNDGSLYEYEGKPNFLIDVHEGTNMLNQYMKRFYLSKLTIDSEIISYESERY